jgi:ketosteroid isomerase-like protein
MNKLLLFCVFGLVLFVTNACRQEENTDVLRSEIIEADRDFSKMASEKGIAEAFLYYADEKVIKPQDGQQPIVGKYALMRSYKENPPKSYVKLTWEPLKAEASGTLGYTFGMYTLQTKTPSGADTTLYGNYVSIWKRKKDGSWRYVLDTGNATPQPVVLKY